MVLRCSVLCVWASDLVEDVSEFFFLYSEVVFAEGVRVDFERDALFNHYPFMLQSLDLFGIVRKKMHTGGSQVLQNFRGQPVIPEIRFKTEFLVCVHGIESLVLKGVCMDFVVQAGPRPSFCW